MTLVDPEEASRPDPMLRKDRTQEGAQDLARELRIPGAATAERIRKREDPLPDRYLGQDPIDEVRRGVGHATTAAGGAKSAALAREGDEAIVAACVAVDPQEAVGEQHALEVRADLAFDEAGDRGACRVSAGEEREALRANDLMKEGLLGLVAGVVGDGWGSAGTGGVS